MRLKLSILSFLIVASVSAKTYTIGNKYMSRTLEVKNGILSTKRIVNKLAGTTMYPIKCDEFSIRISNGTDKEDTKRALTAKDFTVTSIQSTDKGYKFILNDKIEEIELTIFYEINANDAFCHKYIQMMPQKSITLERMDVEAMAFSDAKQNYLIRQINARGGGQWKPGLGQPLYKTKTATFWGVEFPASTNMVQNNTILCG